LPHLDQGNPARTLAKSADEKLLLKPLCLLTIKPMMYVGNVLEDGFRNNPHLDRLRQYADAEGAPVVALCAKIEAELGDLEDEDKALFLADLGLEEPGLNRLIRAAYQLLGLQTYFTAGVKEVRAWTIHVGDTAPQAAGVIHTDFETRLHPRPDDRPRRLPRLQGRAGRQGSRQDARRRQGVRGQGRRRIEFSVQRLTQRPIQSQFFAQMGLNGRGIGRHDSCKNCRDYTRNPKLRRGYR
jgi:hypothetical protein